MVNLKTLFAAAFIFALGGCMSPTYEFNFKSDGTVEEDLEIRISRDVWDMPFFDKSSACEDMEITQSGRDIICTDPTEFHGLDHIYAVASSKDPILEAQFFPVQVTKVDDNSARVQVGFKNLAATIQGQPGLALSYAMVPNKNLFRNQNFTFKFSGAEIIDTNGVVSADGQTVTVSIPLVDVFEDTVRQPDFYATVVHRKCRFFGLFCG